MRCHAEDLRAEIPAEDPERDALVEAVQHDHRDAPLTDADRAMLDFAVHLTRTPEAMDRKHVEALRHHGFGDVAIHDIVQVTALFNYYNRLADGLGIDPEPDH